MRFAIKLRYAREPELVAIRLNPLYSFQGLAKQALRAYIEHRDFKIKMPEQGLYEEKSLICYLALDDQKDKDIIKFLNSLKAPKAAFVRNLMLRQITGDISYAYQDEKLKELGLSPKTHILRAATQDKTEKSEPYSYHDELSRALANLNLKDEV